MSSREAGIYILKSQRSSLKTWGRSVDKMLSETPKGNAKHWELEQERALLQKEINRISHRLRHAV